MKSLLIFSAVLLIAFAICINTSAQSNKQKAMKTQSGYAAVNGINMYYEIHGKGKPIVLIHGGGSTIQSTFGKILPMLATHHKVIAMELQAHGRTSDRNTPESFEQDASDVVALLNYLKIDKADFLGFSNGGQTTMQLAISHPGIVNKIIIVSAFYNREGAVKGFFESMPHATFNDMPAYLKQAYLKVNKDSAALLNMFEKDKARMVSFKGWSDEQIASIKAPAFIMCGDKDVITPAHAAEMHQRIANSELAILPGNHGSFIGEGMAANDNSKIPELAVAMIEEFLNK